MRLRSVVGMVVLSGVVAFCMVGIVSADEQPIAGTYRGTWTVVKFDVSPPLSSIAPLEVPVDGGGLMVDREKMVYQH